MVTLSLREKTFVVRIVCMLNESIDDLFGTPVARLPRREEQKRNFHLPFLFYNPSLPAGGCKFSFTFFGLPAFFLTLKLTCKIITLIIMHTILSLTFLFFFFVFLFFHSSFETNFAYLPVAFEALPSFLPSFLSCTCTYHICMYVL